MARPMVAIVGRPNVGKSTLFNRIVGRRQAVVDHVPGVTRDRVVGEAEWSGRWFFVVDTGGLLPEATRGMDAQIRRQVEAALELASAILFVVDVEVGLTTLDEQIAEVVRESGKPVLVVANKSDSDAKEIEAYEFARLGMGDIHPISALHGRATGDLLDILIGLLPAPAAEAPVRHEHDDERDGGGRAIRVAIVGRPNVGKSSLVNHLLGEERMIVDDLPGTTRDAVDTPVVLDGKLFIFIDTAGLRRRARIDTRTEFYSMVRAVQAIDRADVAVLVLDASEPFGRQDYRIASHIAEARKPAVLLFNKWDLVEKETMTSKHMEDAFREHAVELGYAPSLFISALSGQRIQKLPGLIRAAHAEARRQWGSEELTRVLERAVERTPPPSPPRGRQELRAAVQRGVNPIRLLIETTQPEALPQSYRRYLEHHFREALAIEHAPIDLRFARPRRKRRAPGKERPERKQPPGDPHDAREGARAGEPHGKRASAT